MTEQQKFEQWASANGFDISKESGEDVYVWFSTKWAWMAWLARSNLK